MTDWPWLFDNDGNLIEEKVLDELSDYAFLLEQVPEVYITVTGGVLSKTNYFANSVISAHEDYLERLFEEVAYEAVKDAFDAQLDGESNDDILGRLQPRPLE